MDYFSNYFIFLVLVCIAFQFAAHKGSSNLKLQGESRPVEFRAFQQTYLLVYLLGTLADWLQGPYVYALYEYYGFEQADIALLFIAGFGSSMVFGTFTGALADMVGRKKMAIAYGLIYGAGCFTKLFNHFSILMIGRILSGIATSLLWSVFEAWMVCEHNSRKFAASSLSNTFALATLGNGVVAILAGLVASAVADNYGYVAPFMVALVCCISLSILVALYWTENHGDSKLNISETLSEAVVQLKSNPRIWKLGMIQSLYEASMYTFVFMWTPTLKNSWPSFQLPYGLIFSIYMVGIMIGSAIFGLLRFTSISVYSFAKLLIVVAAVSLFSPVATDAGSVVFSSFVLFEVCCGMYFPSVGVLRSEIIPESSRSTIMNFFRIPLNLLVAVVLVKVTSMPISWVFGACSVWLVVAFCLQTTL